MNITKSSVKEGRKVKVNLGSQEVRHQLQVMVSRKLADRDISTAELWTRRTPADAKLSEEERDRLARQRYNKRKWAQKERARTKALLDQLKETNGILEFNNHQLKREVDKLQQKKHNLKHALVDHRCQAKVSAARTFVHVRLTPGQASGTRGKRDSKEEEEEEEEEEVLGQAGPAPSSWRREKVRGHSHLPLVTWTTVSGAGGRSVSRTVTPPARPHTLPPGPRVQTRTRTKTQTQTWTQTQTQTPIQTRTSPSANLGRIAELRKTAVKAEKLTEAAGVKPDPDIVMQMAGSQASDPPATGDSGQPLSSGGFTVTELAGSGKSYLQTLQEDEDDVQMTAVVSAAPGKRGHPEDRERPSKKGTSGKEEAGGSGSGGDSVMAGPWTPQSSFTDNWKTARPGQQKSHQTWDSVQTSEWSTLTSSFMNLPLELEPAGSDRSHKANHTEADRATQTSGNVRSSVFPQASEIGFPRSAKHMTRKGFLMTRWFAQEHTEELTKKRAKSAIPHRAKRKASRQVIVNPWAVVSSLAADPEPAHSRSSYPPDRRPHLSRPTGGISGEPSIGSTSEAFTSGFLHTLFPTHTPSIAELSPSWELSAGPGPGVSVTTTTADADSGRAVTFSHTAASSVPDGPTGVRSPEADGADLSLPTLTREGQWPTRRFSWPTEEPEPGGGRPAHPARCLSLPSSFSDVVFEMADGGQSLVFPELLLEAVLNPEEAHMDYFPMLAAHPHASTGQPGSSPLTPTPGVTEEARRNIPATLTTEYSPFAPSSPPESFSLGPQPPSAAGGRGSDVRPGKGTIREEHGSQHEEPAHKEYRTLDREGMGGGRVKVERMPDADITWQVLYEMPGAVADQADISRWHPFSAL